MKKLISTGINPRTGEPSFAYVHPFLVGARKTELMVPDSFPTRKTGRLREGFRAVAQGATKAPPKAGKRTT